MMHAACIVSCIFVLLENPYGKMLGLFIITSLHKLKLQVYVISNFIFGLLSCNVDNIVELVI